MKVKSRKSRQGATKIKKPLRDLLERADREIENGTTLAYDVAADNGQILQNVGHMRWFRKLIMQEIAGSVKAYGHLLEKVRRWNTRRAFQ